MKNDQYYYESSTEYSNSRSGSQKRGISNNITVSFDKITVTGSMISKRESFIKRTIESDPEINIWDNGFDRFKCTLFNNKVYVDYNRRQAEVMKKSEMRVEFNPNELNDTQKNLIKYVFLDNMRDKGFSRIDLAFDVRQDLADYYCMCDRGMKRTYIYGADGKIETKYFGTRGSDRYIRIYNKKKQLREVKKEEVIDKDLWRIEFELKRSRTSDWHQCFDDLHILQPAYMTIEKDTTRAMVRMLLGDEGEWGKLNKNTKTKYRKLIKEISDVDLTYDLKLALEQNYPYLNDELKEYIAISHHDKLYDFDF